MNLYNYLSTVNRLWNNEDGNGVSRFITINGNHSTNVNLHVENPDAAVERTIPTPLDEIISCHIKVLFYLHENPPDYDEAYKYQSACVQAVVKMLQALKEENWCLPIMYVTCLDLRLLALKCEYIGGSAKSGQVMEKAAECLMSCFRVCAADNRTEERDTKRLGMLHLVNQMFKVYFRINKLHLCKPLIRAVESLSFKESFSKAQQITYKYFVGRKAMYDSDYKTSDEYLTFAFSHCPSKFVKNKRLILIYLVPVKMLLGYMPRKETMEKFKVPQFHELACALKQGNVRAFDDVMQKYESFFIETGIYIIVEKLKIIAYRNLFKKVYLILQTHQIDLEHFLTALKFVGEDDVTMDETHCIVANLIAEGRIKGYISYQHNKLVVSKQTSPFPSLYGTTS
ncbi:CLUMA_CG012121, isoform A [Clunio marinus]|uniref:PCI domain-containing protein 2 homolog n=1 Tax=Clunio marinus TaxID=568069 RepID=A0A1J1IEU1_9DIPT|nr:CLUMA_CG012121, isoform A [Clunio marinus]